LLLVVRSRHKILDVTTLSRWHELLDVTAQSSWHELLDVALLLAARS
jgi:hypothetical protein